MKLLEITSGDDFYFIKTYKWVCLMQSKVVSLASFFLFREIPSRLLAYISRRMNIYAVGINVDFITEDKIKRRNFS